MFLKNSEEEPGPSFVFNNLVPKEHITSVNELQYVQIMKNITKTIEKLERCL